VHDTDVTPGPSETLAILTVYVWRDGQSPTRLRARATWLTDVRHGTEMTAAAEGHDDILALIGRWLDDVAATAPRPARGPLPNSFGDGSPPGHLHG
jgi:hypothetical protein